MIVMIKTRLASLTARGESPAAFGRRCVPSGCVAPRSNIPDILARRALPAGRIAGLGATPDFHHGLLGEARRLVRTYGAKYKGHVRQAQGVPSLSWTGTVAATSRFLVWHVV